MRRFPAILLASGFVLGFVPSGAPAAFGDESPTQNSAMSAAANEFYGVYKSLGLSDGIPDAKARARYAPYLSPALAASLVAAGSAQTRFAKKNKDAPPLVEGDLFTSLFEGASSFKVGVCSGDASRGRCAVALEYDAPKQKPQIWTDTIMLVNTPQGWRVDDIAYGGSWDFGNKGTLRETLKVVLAEAP